MERFKKKNFFILIDREKIKKKKKLVLSFEFIFYNYKKHDEIQINFSNFI